MANFEDDMVLDDSVITMYDEEGNEIEYAVIANKKDGDCLYMLVEELVNDEETNEEPMAEVLIFKCITTEKEPDELVFEVIDDSHESFDLAFNLFKENLDELGIEY